MAVLVAGPVRVTTSAADVYVGHPRLLFNSAEIPALRVALADGGSDDVAYAQIRSWAGTVLGLPASFLLGTWEGVNTVTPLGLAAWVEANGEPYAVKVREIGLEIARHRPPSNDEFTTALRLSVMAFAYDLGFGSATAAERDEIRTAMRTFLDWMPPRFNFYCQAYNPYAGNHGMTVGAAMGLAAVALWDDVSPTARDTLQARINFADELVDKVLSDILAPDGAFREGVLYAAWSMRVGVPWFEARRRFDGTEPAADVRLHRMLDWLCYELAADGTGRTNNLNDSAWSTRPLALHNTFVPWAEARWGSSLAKYLETHLTGAYGYDYVSYADRVATALWSRPLPVTNPGAVLPRGRLFGERGLYYYRSGWKAAATGQEVVFSFFSGRYYGGHAQEDQNQITLAAYGTRFIVDCGPVSTSQAPKQSEAHNLVLVDGRGEHNAGNSIGTDGRIAASLLSGFADYVRGDAMAAYATYSPYNAAGVPFAFSDWSWGYDGGNPLEQADRTCLVFKGPEAPPWILVADDLRKDAASHVWEWLLHTSQGNSIDLAADPATITAAGASLDVFFAQPRQASLALSWENFANADVDPPTKRIVARAETVEPRYCVALVPRPSGTAAPLYTSSDDGSATTLTLDWGGGVRDVIRHAAHGTPGGVEPFSDGRVGAVRQMGGGVARWLLGEGTLLRAEGLDLVTLGGTGSAAWDGDTLQLSSATMPFRAWAPGARVVVGPAGPMRFVSEGDFVRNVPTSDAGGLAAPRLTFDPPRNPVRGISTAWLRFALRDAGTVRLRIVDARGRQVATLADALMRAGPHALAWNGRDAHGRRVPAGVYVARLEANGATLARKLVLLPE